MNNIAIISFFHLEASICLAKAIAEQGVDVDFYFIADIHHDSGKQPGISYVGASKFPGSHRLNPKTIPEIYRFTKGLPISFNIIRIASYHMKATVVNKMILRSVFKYIRRKHYEAINVVGQWRWVDFIHEQLKCENLIHTFHEVGSHSDGVATNPLMELIIKDRSKVILLSKSTYNRFMSIPGADKCKVTMTSMGTFQTLLLFNDRDNIKIDLPIEKSKTTFLYYGYIKDYKGLGLLLKACTILENKRNDFNLIVAGAGHDDSLCEFEKKENCYVINRFLSDEEMIYLNEIADVVVLPYKSASQTGIVPTSFMFGNPVISTKVGALTEVIIDHKNGLLVEPCDAEGFANAMHLLITDSDLLKSLSMGANSFGHGDDYDWKNIAIKTLEFYHQ